MDPALGFWLQYVESEGGLYERGGGGTLVMLPPSVQRACGAADELTVTSDPDLAREEGATLLAPGHPLLVGAADDVLARGDAGVIMLPRPASVPPSAEVLLAKAREQFPVDHGKIDAADGITPARRGVLRVGVLIEYAVSAEERFQERAECWVDVAAQLELPESVRSRIARSAGASGAAGSGAGSRPGAREPAVRADADLRGALLEAHRVIDARARLRLAELARDAAQDYQAERGRARAYYDEALASIGRRRASASADRAALLDARVASTQQERERRLAEIVEKYRPRHQIRPFRLHLLVVPAMRLPVHVRRGERRYPLGLDWLLPAGEFAGLRCPHCGEPAPLVAAKSRLGCQSCLASAAPADAEGKGGAAPQVAPRAGSRAGRDAGKGQAGDQRPDGQRSAQASSAGPARAGGAKPGRPGDRRDTAAASRRPASSVPPPAASVGSGPAPSASRPASPASRPAASASPRPAPSAGEISAAGAKLARSFWRAAAADEKRLHRMCAPDSPTAAAVTLLGGGGPFRAIGMAPAEEPETVSAMLSVARSDGRNVTTGVVETDAGRHTYQLIWRFDGRVAMADEVVPFGHQFGSRSPVATLFGSPPQPLFAELPPPRIRLEGVARLIWRVALPRCGLPLVLRCITAWWRLTGGPGEPGGPALGGASAHSPTVLAAALERMISYRAAGRGGYADAAAAYRVSETEVRAVTAALQRQLKLSATRQW